MHKFLSLIIATYFLTAGSASAFDVVMDRDCIVKVSGKLWNSTRSKYEANRKMLMEKGWTLSHDDNYLEIDRIGRKQFQLIFVSQGVKWEGNLQDAPDCRKSCDGQTLFVNSKQFQTQCSTQGPTSKLQQF